MFLGKQVQRVSGNIVDVVNSVIYPGTLVIEGDMIRDIIKENKNYDTYIIPGLIDAHVHIESSLFVPSEFARLAVVHGTVGSVSDPHEIANVLGIPGIDYMLEDAKKTPFKFYFGAPSCVPATEFETAGAKIDSRAIGQLLKRKEIKYLSEMMNYPGVINKDPEVIAKLAAAKKNNKVIDGHAPGLLGEDLKIYAQAGITTDHENFEYEEALQEIKLGMKVIIREGSAVKNFDALHTLIGEYSVSCMFCTDDKPDNLVKGHINLLVKRALDLGYDKMAVLRCASFNPIKHYGLEVGLLQRGDYADFIVVDNLDNFDILKTYINGKLVAKNGQTLLKKSPVRLVNNFSAHKKKPDDFRVKNHAPMVNVIEAIDGELITSRIKVAPKVSGDYIVSDCEKDILKIAVVNRYRDSLPAVAFVKNFGLKKGAIASSFAHDSHNIIAVGVTDADIAKAVNLVIKNRGGLAIAYDNYAEILALPIAGLMSNQDGYKVIEKYSRISAKVRSIGSSLREPFMTLSFMALLVIPDLKLSDKGLFDCKKFEFISLRGGE